MKSYARSSREASDVVFRQRAGSLGLTLILGVVAAVAMALLAVFAGEARGAAVLPQGFSHARVATGISNPTTMALAPDGRVFVAEQSGRLRVIKNGQLLSAPFVDLSSVVDPNGERGLLGVAFDPAFSSNRYIYLYFTRAATATVTAHNRVVRFTANGDRVVPGSGKLILRLNPLSIATNHNGGALNFGKDGRLYIAVGENANPDNAQTKQNLLGKMLRVNKDGSIPRDNPFYGNKNVLGKNKAIWALGLRNPYSFGVQPGTGRIFINDVGQQTWEEINRASAGANYGWPIFEGPESDPRYVPPIFAYRHGQTNTTGCAITGGAFYNPVSAQFPAGYVGDYFFADFCGGWIRRYDIATDSATGFATGIQSPVDLDVGRDGSLYYLERGTGSVFRVQRP